MINSSHILFPTYSLHCVEGISSLLAEMFVYAGACSTFGTQYSGDRLTSLRMKYPIGIAYDRASTIYLSLHEYKDIISIDIQTDAASHVGRLHYSPRYIALSINNRKLFVTVLHGVGALSLDDGSFQLISGSGNTGSDVGHITNTTFSNAYGLQIMDQSTWIVADYDNSR